uniref:Vps62-related protein n=1 Tax=Marinobacterium profundum TaxID=1714300 RepID=UPI001315916C|nr:Vps62-related protein [Marinobacterium profundum]
MSPRNFFKYPVICDKRFWAPVVLSVAALGLSVQSRVFAQPASDSQKYDLLRRFAPEIWLAEGERYFPASLDWAFPYFNRVPRNGNWWLYTKQQLSSPSDGTLPVFRGDLNSAKTYAFWVPKATGNTDLVYFIYYPYNRGKELAYRVWGNHVGDWENVIVRLDETYQPQRIFLSQHDQDEIIKWPAITKHSTHPVVYSAWGSHGNYASVGEHAYEKTVLGTLSDLTSRGTRWDTWNSLEAFDYHNKSGLNGNSWPQWMEKDHGVYPGRVNTAASVAGDFNSDGSVGANNTAIGEGVMPASGPIYRWGNGKNGCGGAAKFYEAVSGECRLNDGPTGPIDKDVWTK